MASATHILHLALLLVTGWWGSSPRTAAGGTPSCATLALLPTAAAVPSKLPALSRWVVQPGNITCSRHAADQALQLQQALVQVSEGRAGGGGGRCIGVAWAFGFSWRGCPQFPGIPDPEGCGISSQFQDYDGTIGHLFAAWSAVHRVAFVGDDEVGGMHLSGTHLGGKCLSGPRLFTQIVRPPPLCSAPVLLLPRVSPLLALIARLQRPPSRATRECPRSCSSCSRRFPVGHHAPRVSCMCLRGVRLCGVHLSVKCLCGLRLW